MSTGQPLQPTRSNSPLDERAENQITKHRELNTPFNKVQNALLYGSMGGIVLGVFQVFLNGTQDKISIGVGLLGFLLLTPFLYLGLKKYRSHLAAGEVFKNGIIHGLFISAIASLIMTVIASTGLLWSEAPAMVAVEEVKTGQLIVNSVFQILAGIVFGMIITFIILQGIKSDLPAEEYIEKQS